MTDREKHIKNLSYIMDSMPDDTCGDWRDSLAYAISSLKTDETYQLMYEGEEVYTKADVAALFIELQMEINALNKDMCVGDDKSEMGFVRWIRQSDVNKIIQYKINDIKGEDDE